jgi:glycosyltransferase involved in cell wall biosynthesis
MTEAPVGVNRTDAHPDITTESARNVSVIIPVYNQGEFVANAIESALEQRYSPLELIVVNDGSTDTTADRLKAYQQSARIIHQENRGAAAALNRGIRESQGSLVCWLSADDEFLPGKIEAQVAAFHADPQIGMVHTGYERVDGTGAHIDETVEPMQAHPDPFVTVFWRNSLNGSTVMLRREVFDAVGGFDESLRADVDADMWMKIMRRWEVSIVPGVYVRYRVHQNSLSANTSLMVSTMEEVRRRNMSELLRRVGTGRDAAAVLARMSADTAEQGLFTVARRLRRASVHAGLAPREQVRSLAAEVIARLRSRASTRRAGRAMLLPWRVLRGRNQS